MFLRGVFAGFALCVVLIVAVGAFASAFSQQWASATVRSKHLMEGKYNEANYGLGIEYHIPETDTAIVAGFFDNSKKEIALYAGAAYLPLKLDLEVAKASLGLMGAFFWGYSNTPVPGIALMGTLERNGYGINLLYFPPKKDTFSNFDEGLLALQIKWKLP